MSYLRLNGWTIPLDSDATAKTWAAAQRTGRAATGAMSQDRTCTPRGEWSLKTTRMKFADLHALWDWMSGRPLVWSFDNTIVSNLAANLLVSSSATQPNYRSALAADGTSNLSDAAYTAAAGPATTCTNLLTSNQATGTDTSSTTTGHTAVGSATLASSTTRAWQGTRSLSVASTGVGDGYKTTGLTGTSGQPYAGSVYLTGPAGTVLTVAVKQNSTVLASKQVTLTTGWRRCQVPMLTGTLPLTNDVHLEVTQVSAAAATWYADGQQMEVSRFTTPWVNGSRATPSYLYTTAPQGVLGSSKGITINAWCTEPESPNGAIVATLTDTIAGSNPTYIKLWCPTGSGTVQLLVSYNGTSWTLNGTMTWATASALRMLTASVCPGGVGGPELALYIDGVLVNSSSPGLAAAGYDPRNLNRVYHGHDNGAFLLNGALDDLMVLPFATGKLLPAALQAYATAAPAAWPLLTADGDFNNGASMSVMCFPESIDVDPFIDPLGVYETAGGCLSFRMVVA